MRFGRISLTHCALRLARMLVGDDSHAEDIAAESVARLLVARRRTTVDNANAYLRRVVVNQVIGRGRRSATERRFGHRVATAPTAADTTDRVVGEAVLAVALKRLPARQRAVLVLRYYEDLPEATVAELLHIPVGTVKSSASRGLDDLRRLLTEADGHG
jgi:RNA polymerase sigma factor (sigma-70 family)